MPAPRRRKKSHRVRKKGNRPAVRPDAESSAGQLLMTNASREVKLTVRRLVSGEEALALDFLNRQPLRYVALIGLLREHGLESPCHRGSFYGCFSDERLIGVALLGHFAVLSGSPDAIVVFANVARLSHETEIRLILGDEASLDLFGRILSQPPSRLLIHSRQSQVMYALTELPGAAAPVEGLRPARPEEIEEITRIHARSFLEQTGVDAQALDGEGFRQRVLARIRRGRIWILCGADGITFKADVAAETEEAAYLEGIWTRPDLRGAGVGSRAMKDLCQQLLRQHHVICLFAEATDQRARAFYQRVGFAPLDSYGIVRCLPSLPAATSRSLIPQLTLGCFSSALGA
jgi:GNAT superfamily N-acetyltransferase